MTYEAREYEEELGKPELVCGLCAHSEIVHEVREAELPGQTEQAVYCIECEDWHSFVPAAEV